MADNGHKRDSMSVPEHSFCNYLQDIVKKFIA